MKIVGLHALYHEDDKNDTLHCVICDHAITHNLTPALTPDLQDFTIENTQLIVKRKITKNYNFIILSTIASDQLFSRPPPFLL